MGFTHAHGEGLSRHGKTKRKCTAECACCAQFLKCSGSPPQWKCHFLKMQLFSTTETILSHTPELLMLQMQSGETHPILSFLSQDIIYIVLDSKTLAFAFFKMHKTSHKYIDSYTLCFCQTFPEGL